MLIGTVTYIKSWATALIPLELQVHVNHVLMGYVTMLSVARESRNSSVGIGTGWTAGVRFPAGANDFSLHSVQTGSGAHPASIQWVPGVLSPGVKREAAHSPPTTAEVKNTWIYTSTPPYAFMA
jgi:hypothetical protein